jgi:UDPglucose 6-dehydrogenase
MKITIAGYGFVGRAHAEIMQHRHLITVSDPAFAEYNQGIPVDTTALIICVSTPPHASGACNVNNVYDVISQTRSDIPILIKSTISLEGWNTIRESFPHHRLAFSPEFLVAKTATEDFRNTKHLYFGGDDTAFWHCVFEVVFKDFTSSTASVESLIVAKYMRNSFLATKVAFFNQIYDLCEAYGIDYEQTAAVVGADPRIGMSHTIVTPDRGFGGHCFPKDTSAIVKTAQRNNVELSIIEEAIKYNNAVRTTN